MTFISETKETHFFTYDDHRGGGDGRSADDSSLDVHGNYCSVHDYHNDRVHDCRSDDDQDIGYNDCDNVRGCCLRRIQEQKGFGCRYDHVRYCDYDYYYFHGCDHHCFDRIDQQLLLN